MLGNHVSEQPRARRNLLVEVWLFCPHPSPGGRGPSSSDGPNGPLRSSESADIGGPAFQRR
eukprot:11993060-Alexandrium_andersonii.AAC.1